MAGTDNTALIYMIEYVKLYHFYSRPLLRIFRYVVFSVLFIFVVYAVLRHSYPRIPLFFLSLFFMFEIFFREKVIKKIPPVSITGNPGENIFDSATLALLNILLYESSTNDVIKQLTTKEQILFLLEKANINLGEMIYIDVPKDQVAKYAFGIVKNLGGRYITTIDFVAAYLLLTEVQTKLLFKKELKEDEFMHIIYWARSAFPHEETPITHEVMFEGAGIAEDWNTGWTFETRKYIVDFTQQMLHNNPQLMWRKKEYETLVEILSGSVKNSAVLVGDPGVGKTSLIAEVAIDSFAGRLAGQLYHQKFYQLMVGALVAGATNAGELEARIQPVMEELAHAGNIILFIPEMENMVGASTFKTDLSGAFFPYLKNGNFRIVASITPEAYKEFIEPKVSFSEVFDSVHLYEPAREEMIQILLEKAHEIEHKNNCSLTYKAVVAAVDYSKRFMPDHAMPGSAIALLSFVASRNIYTKKRVIDEHDVTGAIEEKTHIAVAMPQKEEKELLLHLEDRLHERVVDQEDAVHAIAEALRRIRSGMGTGIRPISFLFLGPTGVGKTETARALAALYFGGEENMIRLDMSEYTSQDSINRLLGAAPGLGNQRGELTEKVREHPFSLVLLDEFEKAHPDILNLFLQVFEDGRLTDNHGKTISFVNTIIIATSNAGAEFIREEIKKGKPDIKKFQQELLDLLQSKGIFKPELLNRFDDIIAFSPLGDEQVLIIAQLLLKAVSQTLEKQDITVTFDQSVVQKVVKEGFDAQFGARPLRRFIQNNIEDVLAQKILSDEIKRGEKVQLSVDTQGNILIAK